jgi:amino acid transporter
MSFFRSCVDSFKPQDEEARRLQSDGREEPGALKRTLESRHLQMIAIGGSIGTGLFVGAGGSLQIGGPANVLIAFLLVGTMLFTVVHALGELAVLFPIQGSFAIYGTRFLDPAWGFAMGWNYALQWLVVLPLELSAAAIVVDYWNTNLNNGVLITIFFVVIICINMFGVKGYGEAEFVFSIIKVIAVLGFIVCAVCIDVGWSPSKKYFGVDTWKNPGAFHNGFPGLCACFVNAAFSFGGTELVGLAAAETADPVKTLPKATKQVFWRILFFYVISLLLVGFIVPYDDPNLLNGTSDAATSPFVIAMNLGEIKVLPSIFNAVILTAVLSVGNSSTYASSRTVAALAGVRQAPRILGYIDRGGRPMVALILALLFGGLAYIGLASSGVTVFNWLLAISGLSQFFTWASICLCHIRFREGWQYHGHKLSEIPFRSATGVIGSYYGCAFNILCLVAQLYVAIWPPGKGNMFTVEEFFEAYLAVPVIVLSYIGYKWWYRTKFISLANMDVDTGRKHYSIDTDAEKKKWYRALADDLF